MCSFCSWLGSLNWNFLLTSLWAMLVKWTENLELQLGVAIPRLALLMYYILWFYRVSNFITYLLCIFIHSILIGWRDEATFLVLILFWIKLSTNEILMASLPTYFWMSKGFNHGCFPLVSFPSFLSSNKFKLELQKGWDSFKPGPNFLNLVSDIGSRSDSSTNWAGLGTEVSISKDLTLTIIIIRDVLVWLDWKWTAYIQVGIMLG